MTRATPDALDLTVQDPLAMVPSLSNALPLPSAGLGYGYPLSSPSDMGYGTLVSARGMSDQVA